MSASTRPKESLPVPHSASQHSISTSSSPSSPTTRAYRPPVPPPKPNLAHYGPINTRRKPSLHTYADIDYTEPASTVSPYSATNVPQRSRNVTLRSEDMRSARPHPGVPQRIYDRATPTPSGLASARASPRVREMIVKKPATPASGNASPAVFEGEASLTSRPRTATKRLPSVSQPGRLARNSQTVDSPPVGYALPQDSVPRERTSTQRLDSTDFLLYDRLPPAVVDTTDDEEHDEEGSLDEPTLEDLDNQSHDSF